MAVLLALYPKPDNISEFETYYWNNHIPLVKKMPGLQSMEVSKGQIQGEESPYYLVARLTWESRESMDLSLSSEEGKLASDDVGNFAPVGSKVLLYETISV